MEKFFRGEKNRGGSKKNTSKKHPLPLAAKVDDKQISVQDSQFLAYLVELFYGTDDGDLVRHFRYKPESFSHEMVVDRIERMIASGLARPPAANQSKGTVAREKKEKSNKTK